MYLKSVIVIGSAVNDLNDLKNNAICTKNKLNGLKYDCTAFHSKAILTIALL